MTATMGLRSAPRPSGAQARPRLPERHEARQRLRAGQQGNRIRRERRQQEGEAEPIIRESKISDESADEYTPPKGKQLYRWCSAIDADLAKKNGIVQYDDEEYGIPASLEGSQAIAKASGAVNLEKCLIIDTDKIPNGKYRMVSTRKKVKEIKVMVSIPKEAIKVASSHNI